MKYKYEYKVNYIISVRYWYEIVLGIYKNIFGSNNLKNLTNY